MLCNLHSATSVAALLQLYGLDLVTQLAATIPRFLVYSRHLPRPCVFVPLATAGQSFCFCTNF
eukprot:scaffold95872_cov28-Tisochrysis_lutea.AAC.1